MEVMKVAFLVALVVAMATPRAVQAQASVQLVNLVGDPVTATCGADNGARRGLVSIRPMGVEAWGVSGEMQAVGWACHFEWADSSDCAGGPPCRLHTQDVRVWQGVMGHRKQLVGAIALTPCASCVWQIKFDGFYRADQKDLQYTFIAGWNWAI